MTNRRWLTALFVLLALGAQVSPAVGQTSAESADLAIRQPEYVDSDVETFTSNGTRGYRVAGPHQTIRPQNFDPDNVVNAGVATEGGQLAFDHEMEVYRFDPQGNEGTYELFWTVEKEVTRETENGTETVTQRTQYNALIRVTGQTAIEHQPVGTQDEIREDARKWREYNSTVNDIREMDLLLMGDQVTNKQITESSLSLFITSRDPPRALQGGFTTFHMMIVIGGVGFTAAALFWAYVGIRSWYKERKKNQRHESTEDAEGGLKEELRELDDHQRLQVFNNWDHTDICPNDHFADGLRSLGDTARESYERVSNEILLPEVWVRDKLIAMKQAGYVAEVVERSGGEISDARLVKNEDVGEDVETIELDGELSESLMEILCNDDTFVGFDLTSADVEPTEMENVTTLDVKELDEELSRQLDWFDDEETGVELLKEFFEAVSNSPYTDDEGTPIRTRRALNEFLNQTQLLRDTFSFRLSRLQADMLEAALAAHDPAKEADKYRKNVEEGRV